MSEYISVLIELKDIGNMDVLAQAAKRAIERRSAVAASGAISSQGIGRPDWSRTDLVAWDPSAHRGLVAAVVRADAIRD